LAPAAAGRKKDVRTEYATPTTVTQADSRVVLDDLAGAIRIEHGAVTADIGSALDHAMNAGDLLVEAKDRVGHGRWADWLRKCGGLSQRTATNYIALAKARFEIEANRHAHANLTIQRALRLAGKNPSGSNRRARAVPALTSASWRAASPEERRVFVEAVGPDELLAAVTQKSTRTTDPEPLSGTHLARIGNLLGVALSTHHDGEALAALQMVNKVLASQGRDFHNLTAVFKQRTTARRRRR
jgi:hypothetical protein